jgi:hypothetical protein
MHWEFESDIGNILWFIYDCMFIFIMYIDLIVMEDSSQYTASLDRAISTWNLEGKSY